MLVCIYVYMSVFARSCTWNETTKNTHWFQLSYNVTLERFHCIIHFMVNERASKRVCTDNWLKHQLPAYIHSLALPDVCFAECTFRKKTALAEKGTKYSTVRVSFLKKKSKTGKNNRKQHPQCIVSLGKC